MAQCKFQHSEMWISGTFVAMLEPLMHEFSLHQVVSSVTIGKHEAEVSLT